MVKIDKTYSSNYAVMSDIECVLQWLRQNEVRIYITS